MNLTTALGEPTVVRRPYGPIRVYERGTGAPIVFVHGLLANAAAWRKVVPLLADGHRCITVDWPFGGHSLPMTPGADLSPTGLADIVADLIEHLDLREVTLVGNDGGGMLSQLLVTRRPERIARLVLTPCDAYDNFPPPMFQYLCWLARVPRSTSAFSRLLRVTPIRRFFARLPFALGRLTHHQIDGDLIDHYLHGFIHDPGIRRDTFTFLRAVDNCHTLDAAAHFRDVKLPVLVAWATEDRVFPYQHAQRLAEDFPNARLEPIPDSLTWVPEDQPEILARLIAEFAAE